MVQGVIFMRKTAIIFILFLSLFIPTVAVAVAGEEKADELSTLASLAMKQNLEIDSWQVTLKENMNQEQLQNVINKLKTEHTISTIEDENAVKYFVKNTHKIEGVSVTYKAIIPKAKSLEGKFIAVITGDTWGKSSIDTYQHQLQRITNQYFTEFAKRFACLATEVDDIMKSDRFLNDTLEYLDLKYVSTQNDKISDSTNKKFLYGYTSLWQQKINVLDQPVNVQIAIKNMENDNSKITVGTPILINEY